MVLDLFFRTERTQASGEVTLRTTQFLDQLRKNPTLKIMRDELVSVLQEQLEKIGIPPVRCFYAPLTVVREH